jgi:DNA mismatch repair ATPase MutS
MVVLLLSAAVWPAALFPLLVGAVVNMFIRGFTARRLMPLTIPFRQAAAVIATAKALTFLGQDDTNPLLEPLRSDVPRLQRLHRFLRWTGRDPAGSGELASIVLEYLNMMFLIDINAAYFASAEVRLCGQSLFRVAAAVGEVDAAIAVASFRASTAQWTKPSFVAPGARASMQEIRHPLLEEPVPNSLDWSPPNGFLVTGSNMSGKTTFIRTVGVNAVLAQTIHTCLAEKWEAPVLRVRSCIARTDDLLAGKSYYLVEVEAVLALVQASASPAPHLFLFDELFRGTNAVERVSAAAAVLTEILDDGGERRPHLVLAATHDAELIEWLSEQYAACHLADELGPTGILFTFRLRPGPATTRNAIALLQLHGAPPALVSRALERAAWLDRQRERWG